MQTSTASPVSTSAPPSNTTTVTKSKEQILIQSECGCTSNLTSCIQFSVNKIERFKPGLINVNYVQCNQFGFQSSCSDKLFFMWVILLLSYCKLPQDTWGKLCNTGICEICKFEAVTEKQAIKMTAALSCPSASGSGAMIALIVIGIIIVLAILLIAMKTYNR